MSCAVILTAIPVEYKAVRAHLSDCQQKRQNDGTIYEEGTFRTNGADWKVVIREVGAGGVKAASETTKAIYYFDPQVIFFVGIAGGIKDVKLGDVVVANKVYSYELGKATDEDFLHTLEVLGVSYSLEEQAKVEAREENWLERLVLTPPATSYTYDLHGEKVTPEVKVGAIAAGEKVIASTKSEVYQLISRNYRDALAIEMESQGFLGALRASPQIKALVVRGISDLLDNKGETDKQGFQKIASRHASAFAFQVLAKLSQQDSAVSAVFKGETSKSIAATSVSPSFSFQVVTVNRQGKIIQRETKQAKYFTADLGNNITLDMVHIPGGTFMMGAPADERGSSDNERPQHQVSVPSFFLGKYPVTQKQWRQVASLPKVKRDLNPDPSRFKGQDRPVESVSWSDAVEFCARLSAHTGQGYRLPSEAEWEYAARSGTTTPFHFGETMTSELANYNASITYADEPAGRYGKETTPVGSFPANAFGLCDMHGNVWEWCADDWHENYRGAPSDGSAWIDGNNNDSQFHVLRGGSWIVFPRLCRSASRYLNVAGFRNYDDGFCVVCGVPRTQ